MPEASEEKKEQPPTAEELAEFRKLLAAGEESAKFGTAFMKLTLHEPPPVTDFLVRWTSSDKERRDADRGYALGSWFASKCGKDRAQNLAKLLDAKDPNIRVAGAVYLCYDDADRGMKELKKLTALEGDPGTWAALTLARRGDKDAVPRALDAFQ